MRTIGFLHTSPVHVATFDALLPSAETVAVRHAVDESLLLDARAQGADAVRDRVAQRVGELVAAGADVVCCTCSTIGGVAEEVDAGVPVVRVDRPMARRAVVLGARIVVVAALASTVDASCTVIESEARAVDRDVTIDVVTVPEAWALFEAGDREGYEVSIEQACRSAATRVDVIVLAQASMMGVIVRLEDLDVPVLASPPLAVESLTQET